MALSDDTDLRLAVGVGSPVDHAPLTAVVPLPQRCQLYRAGHTVHVVQAKLACAASAPYRVGVLIDIAAGVITVRVDGGLLRYRNHETALLRRAVARYGPSAVVRDRSVLGLRLDEGEYLFSVAPIDDEWTPCSPHAAEGCEVAPATTGLRAMRSKSSS